MVNNEEAKDGFLPFISTSLIQLEIFVNNPDQNALLQYLWHIVRTDRDCILIRFYDSIELASPSLFTEENEISF